MSAHDSTPPSRGEAAMLRVATELRERVLLIAVQKAADRVYAAWCAGMGLNERTSPAFVKEFEEARANLERFRAKNGL